MSPQIDIQLTPVNATAASNLSATCRRLSYIVWYLQTTTARQNIIVCNYSPEVTTVAVLSASWQHCAQLTTQTGGRQIVNYS